MLLYDIINLAEIKITEDPTTDLSNSSRRISDSSVTGEIVTQQKSDINTKPVGKAQLKTLSAMSREELNSNYMSAVENGDMDTAQKFVDEAAKHENITGTNMVAYIQCRSPVFMPTLLTVELVFAV